MITGAYNDYISRHPARFTYLIFVSLTGKFEIDGFLLCQVKVRKNNPNNELLWTFYYAFLLLGSEGEPCHISIQKHIEYISIAADDEILGQWESGDNTVVGLKFSRRNISITNFADLKTGLPVSQTMTDLAGKYVSSAIC